MSMRERLWMCGALVLVLTGCASSPDLHLASAADILQQKARGLDDSELLTWVKDPSRAFDLFETDFEKLSGAGVGEVVLGELRWRTEEYRRSSRLGRRKPGQTEKSRNPPSDGHNH